MLLWSMLLSSSRLKDGHVSHSVRPSNSLIQQTPEVCGHPNISPICDSAVTANALLVSGFAPEFGGWLQDLVQNEHNYSGSKWSLPLFILYWTWARHCGRVHSCLWVRTPQSWHYHLASWHETAASWLKDNRSNDPHWGTNTVVKQFLYANFHFVNKKHQNSRKKTPQNIVKKFLCLAEVEKLVYQ